MKKIHLFGFKFVFNLERENKDDVQVYSEVYSLKEKIIYIILAMVIIILSYKIIPLFDRNDYKKGSIVKENIYSPKDVKYNDLSKRKTIVEEIVLTSKKEYIFISEIKTDYLRAFESFYNQVELLKRKRKIDFNYKIIEDIIGKNIKKEIVREVYNLKLKDIISQKSKLKLVLEKIYEDGVKKDNDIIKLSEYSEKEIENLNELEKKVVDAFIAPNYIFDKDKTKKEIEKKIDGIGDQIVEISAGTLIAKKGEILTEKKIDMLNKVGIYSYSENILRLVVNIVYLITVSVGIYNVLFNKLKKEILNKNIYRATFFIIVGLLLIYRFIDLKYLYIIPFEISFFLGYILVNINFSFMMSIVALIYTLPLTNYNILYFITSFISIFLGLRFFKNIKMRSQFISIGIQVAIFKFIIYTMLSYLFDHTAINIVFNAGLIILSGLISGMISMALLPYFERTFNILTQFKLLELGDLSQPLLRDLSVKAPGTFYHSMMVATISEAAAEAVGADNIFVRVASYYHDIGKMKRPKFFVENQEGGENPHGGLSPYLSSLIILSHTKDGAELAKEHGIPKQIRDIMYEHQGTTLLAFFYRKAKEQDENVSEEDFRYSGPKPKSKESGIIMLADSVEAAVRSLDEKNYSSIEGMIRKIISQKIQEGQLSDVDLTFKDIEIIIKVFTKTLVSIHHGRIKYPGQEKMSKIENKK